MTILKENNMGGGRVGLGRTSCLSLLCMYFQTWERVGIIRGHSGAVSGLQIMGKVLITACFDQLVRCFDIEVRYSIAT